MATTVNEFGQIVPDDDASGDKIKSQSDNNNNIVTGDSNGSSSPTMRQHNPLATYSSSTYRLGLYMITPEDGNQFAQTGTWDLKSMTLIVQSGGITKSIDGNRSPYFGLDLYMDNLEIDSVVSPKGNQVSTTSFKFKFQIFEPYGISFTTNLINAAIDMQKKSEIQRSLDQPIEALMVDYLLAVHFYGYDADGKITSGPPDINGTQSSAAGGAAFERLFPITITKMGFKLDNKMAIYDIQATMSNFQVAFGQKRGIIEDATSVNADTVQTALDLIAAAMNRKQELISGSQKGATQEIPDEYEYVFVGNSNTIGNEYIVDKNHYVISSTPMPDVISGLNINVRLADSAKSEVVKQKRQIQLAPGSTVMSVIDQIITQSTFVSKALEVVDKEIIDKTKSTEQGYSTNAKPKPLYWYHVTPQIIKKKFDHKRHDFAYKIRYLIQQKEVPYVRSPAVKTTTSYKGAFKRYDYWYTGKNTEILSYEQTYNMLYFTTGAASSEAATTPNKDVAPTSQKTVSDASGVGSLPNSKENPNTVRTALYSPGDQINAHIKILGDPDYLVTSEAGAENLVAQQWYGNDYTLNPATGQVFIEIGFRQVTDYNINSGLLEPNNDIVFWDYPNEVKAIAGNRMIYMVISFKSNFSRGMFTQELKTIIPPFSTKSDTTKETQRETPAAKPANQSTSSTQADIAYINNTPFSSVVSSGNSRDSEDENANKAVKPQKPGGGRGSTKQYDTSNKTTNRFAK